MNPVNSEPSNRKLSVPARLSRTLQHLSPYRKRSLCDSQSLREQRKRRSQIRQSHRLPQRKELKKSASSTNIHLDLPWDVTAVNGEHLWLDTSSFKAVCNLLEDECQRSGLKKKCSICKMVVHSGCLPKLKYPCRLTFREITAKDFQSGKSDEDFTMHHWVHRKRLTGKCNSCTQTLQTKFHANAKTLQTKFHANAKNVIAIQCSWCKVVYHNKSDCFGIHLMTDVCLRGHLSNVIVPPHWIIKLPGIDFTLDKRRQSQPLTASDDCFDLRSTTDKLRLLSLSGLHARSAYDLKQISFHSLSASAGTNPYSNTKRDDNSPSVCDSLVDKLMNCSTNPCKLSSRNVNPVFLVKPSPASCIRPIVVFVNPKSGGKLGMRLAKKFHWHLNPRQVFILNADGPEPGLRIFCRIPNMRILACGGDGTLGWILSEMDRLSLPFFPIAILPLGTGNDMSRATNWGAVYTDEPLDKILRSVDEGSVISVDRWNLIVQPSPHEVENSNDFVCEEDTSDCNEPMTSLPINVFNNYFSIGIDASTALEFHTSREANPGRFGNRLKNMLFYASTGSKSFIKNPWRDLTTYVTLTCDGIDYTKRLREMRPLAILFLNIPRYCGGTLPWGTPSLDSSLSSLKVDDNCFEVIGLSSKALISIHVGRHGDRICQCSRAVLTTICTLPMQVDGEPCRMKPCTIEIYRRNQANIIVKPTNKPIGFVLNKDR